MNEYCVYKHTAPNGKVYIGITCQNPIKRWRYGHGYRENSHFWNAIVKYGWDNIQHEILFDGLCKTEAEEKEIELIKTYKCNQAEYGYNQDNGGNATGKMTDEQKGKIRNALMGHSVSQEAKAKMRVERYLYAGRLWSLSELAEMSGVPYGTLHARLSIYNMPIEKAIKRKVKRSDSLPVFQYDASGRLVGRFDSVLDAQKRLGIQHISDCCRGKRKTSGGYVWRYADIW